MKSQTSFYSLFLALMVALLVTAGCKKSDDSVTDVPVVAEAPVVVDPAAAHDEHDGHDHGDHAADPHAGHAHAAGDGADCGCDAKDGADCAHGAGCEHGADCGCDAKPGEACGCGAKAGDKAAHGDHAAMAGGGDTMDLVLAEGEYDPAKVVRQPGAKVGDLTRCTVSGDAFIVTDQHAHVTHEGQEVYFCCPGCIRRFQREPARYLDAQ